MQERTALIIGHPGHELRVYKFLQLLKPRVYILTDGSGYNKRSRVESTMKILLETGATPSEMVGVFTDIEFYDTILSRNTDVLTKVMKDIIRDLRNRKIDMVFGDAIEGFNPTHDLCRYMINTMVKALQIDSKHLLKNYDFLLEAPPDQIGTHEIRDARMVHLSNDELNAKINAALGYQEVAYDVSRALKHYGKQAFSKECLRPVSDLDKLTNWENEAPYYETYGKTKVEQGQYKTSISFEAHMLPLGKTLMADPASLIS